METKEDVKTQAGNPSEAVKEADEKGVPWENRAKEYERKLSEAMSKLEKLEQAQAYAQEANSKETSKEEVEDAKKRKILAFVEDPDGFLDRELQRREYQRELPEAETWLRNQAGFAKDDEARVAQIIRDHQLNQPSPMLRAKAAYRILQAEKLESEFSEKRRESQISKTMPDGSGRSTSVDAKPKRSDLIRQLAEAESKGDLNKASDLLNLLEDTRA